jgi:hypothetical protein
MSTTMPDAAHSTSSAARPRRQRVLLLQRGSNFVELRGASLSFRLGRLESYARRRAAGDPRWGASREPGGFEAYGFGLGLSVSRAPVPVGR